MRPSSVNIMPESLGMSGGKGVAKGGMEEVSAFCCRAEDVWGLGAAGDEGSVRGWGGAVGSAFCMGVGLQWATPVMMMIINTTSKKSLVLFLRFCKVQSHSSAV